uniref:Mediator of RNA polymerase II transcription subunit 24 n=1 Tax=Panagrellus redivivus TaxID=6233 RepID=A0A7E4UWG5_PANRE
MTIAIISTKFTTEYAQFMSTFKLLIISLVKTNPTDAHYKILQQLLSTVNDLCAQSKNLSLLEAPKSVNAELKHCKTVLEFLEGPLKDVLTQQQLASPSATPFHVALSMLNMARYGIYV